MHDHDPRLELPSIEGKRVILRLPPPAEAANVVEYLTRNREHNANAGPAYPAEYFEVGHWQRLLEDNIEEYRAGHSARLFIFERQQLQPMDRQFAAVPIGSANLAEIVRKAAQFCYLGYMIDKDKEGQGFMREALEELIKFAFEDLNLHRIMANYQPHNVRSGAVLKRLGFNVEGYARDYLHINGKWCDHILTSLTNPRWTDA
jgi:ribosomal-protein-alanine N-acetyltransferase